MASDRRQINVRLDPDTERTLAELKPVVSKSIGLEVSQADLFRLGILELRKKFMPDAGEPATAKPKKK